MKPQYAALIAATLIFCTNVGAQEAQKINKCIINERVVYQSESCPNTIQTPLNRNSINVQQGNKSSSQTNEQLRVEADARRAEQSRQREEIQKGFRDFSPAPALAAGALLGVPSDSKAQFFVLEKGGSGAQRTIVTKRVGPSGTSYSERLFNCTNSTWKYLGTGDSLAEMAASKANPNMGPILNGSIAYYVGVEACK